MSDPRVTFAFGTRGLARVKSDMQSVLNAAARGANTTAGRGNRPALARVAEGERVATREALIASATRRRAKEREYADAQKYESRISGVAAAGARARGLVTNAEVAARAKAFAAVTKIAEQSETARTRVTEREARRRGRLEEQEAKRRDRRAQQEQRSRERTATTRGREWSSNAERFAQGAYGYASSMHGEIQGERRHAAQIQRTAGLAFFQAGARSPAEIAARVAQTRAFAQANGMTSEELLAGANAAQTEFSSLQGGTEEERQGRFTNMLSTMLLARNTGNDAGEFARLQGMLAQTGFDPAMQRRMLLYTAGATQQGAVEAGTMTREGMGSIMRRMQDAIAAAGPGATEAQKNEAAAGAFREQVAEMQVFKGQGTRAGLAGNALANMQTGLRGANRQDKILNNIAVARAGTNDTARQAQLDRFRDSLFEADPTRTGHQRMRQNMQNPAAFASAYITAMGENADGNGLANLLAGGGHGNPQSMLANWRTLLSSLVSRDTTGRTGASRVMALSSESVALTEQRVNEGAAIFANDSLSNLNREDETRAQALLDSAATTFSNAVARFTSENPFAAAALGTVLPNVLGFGARSAGRVAAGVIPGAPGSPGGGAGVAVPGVAGGLTGGQTLGVAAAGLAGAALGDQLNTAIQNLTTDRNQRDGSMQDHNTFSIFGDGLSAFIGELRTLPAEIGRAVAGSQSQPQAAAMAAQLARADEAARQRRT